MFNTVGTVNCLEVATYLEKCGHTAYYTGYFMKAVCSKHVYAYDTEIGCPWCAPSPKDVGAAAVPNILDIFLPDPHQSKGFLSITRHAVRMDVMVHLRESYAMDASVVRWDGLNLPAAVSKTMPSYMEKTFCITATCGSWLASYLGPDGEVWKAHLLADTEHGDWVFKVREYP